MRVQDDEGQLSESSSPESTASSKFGSSRFPSLFSGGPFSNPTRRVCLQIWPRGLGALDKVASLQYIFWNVTIWLCYEVHSDGFLTLSFVLKRLVFAAFPWVLKLWRWYLQEDDHKTHRFGSHISSASAVRDVSSKSDSPKVIIVQSVTIGFFSFKERKNSKCFWAKVSRILMLIKLDHLLYTDIW